jgi:hypothetical protein
MIKELTVIGTTDQIDLPEFNLEGLGCKVDTGAATSAIHCASIKVKEIDGVDFVSFMLLDSRHPLYNGHIYQTSLFKEKNIKSSFGHSEARFAIKTTITLFGKTYPIWFTLSDREKMKYPILLGKRFLKRRFLVDVSQKDLSYQLKTAL